MKPKTLAAALGSLSLFTFAPSLALADGTLVAKPIGSTDAPYGYVEYLPPGYDTSPDLRYPVIVVLHGVGEEGDGKTTLFADATQNGPLRTIKDGSTYYADHPTIVLAPQSATWWSSGTIHKFFQYVVSHYRVTPERVYLTGLSMGGGGTWDYVYSHGGERLAAILPICGASSPSANGMPKSGKSFVGLPTWAFHNWDDPTVTRKDSIGWVNNIADAIAGKDVPDVMAGYPHASGDASMPAVDTETALFDGKAWAWKPGVQASGTSDLRLTLNPTGGHDAWKATYKNTAVLDWFEAQQRPRPAGLEEAVIVDNVFETVSYSGSFTRVEDPKGYYFWDYHLSDGKDGASASFPAKLPAAGWYEIFVSYVAASGNGDAQIEVSTAGGVKKLSLDQSKGGGFTSIGTFSLGEAPVVKLTASGGKLVADAVAFLAAGDPGSGGAAGASGAGGTSSGGSAGSSAGQGGSPGGAGGSSATAGSGGSGGSGGLGGSGGASGSSGKGGSSAAGGSSGKGGSTSAGGASGSSASAGASGKAGSAGASAGAGGKSGAAGALSGGSGKAGGSGQAGGASSPAGAGGASSGEQADTALEDSSQDGGCSSSGRGRRVEGGWLLAAAGAWWLRARRRRG